MVAGGQVDPGFNPSSYGGRKMFQDPSNWTPNVHGQQPYDLSGSYAGLNMLKNAPGYQKTNFSPYQFGQVSNVGKPKATDEGMYQNVFNQALNTASKPILAQGQESMRQLGQGFEGGRLGGAANAELALKNSQNTGANIQNTATGIGSTIAQQRLGEQQNINQQEFLENQRQRDLTMQQQQNQANENFRGAGFSDSQSQFMSNDLLSRAIALMSGGNSIASLQGQLTGMDRSSYNNLIGGLQGMFGI